MSDQWFIQALIENSRKQILFPENIFLYQYLFYKAKQNKITKAKETLLPTLPLLKEKKKERRE